MSDSYRYKPDPACERIPTGWAGEKRWRCLACGWTRKYYGEIPADASCPMCPIDAKGDVPPEGVVDSPHGRYRPGGKMRKLVDGPYYCDACNSVHSVRGVASVACPVCAERERLHRFGG